MLPRLAFAAVALLLLALIGWAATQASLWDSVSRVAADPWGLVMLGDLYAGFLAATALFFLVERPATAVVLFVALMILGNVVTLLWLAVRAWPVLRARLS